MLVPGAFDPMQAQTYSIGVPKSSPADKYAVLASVDTTATAINWSGQMNATCQSSECMSSILTAAYILMA